MEFGSSDAIELVKCVGNWTWEQARFSVCFNSLVEEFDQEKKKLEAYIDDMHKNVKNSIENTIEVASRDKFDLKNAEDLKKEVDKLQEEAKLKKACCHGCCPDLYWQDRLGRQLVDKTENMKKLNAQFQPQKLSRIQSLPGMEYYSSKDFIPLRSTTKAFDELLTALNDPNIRRIGLHGMGGCGKTTLVKEVGKEAQKLFEKVVFVTVSRNLEVRKIQSSIADHLNLTLKEENEQVRAKRLYLRLSGSEKILIILDDVWEELNFEAIGIPFHDNSEGCRILLTTRLRGVCVSLRCKEVSLGLLSEEEAWQLFQKYAGINENASEKFLKGLPRDINKACKGLPIAITAFAKALKDKDLDDWKDVYDLLKHCQQVDIQNKSEDPYGSLEFSYNCLEDKEAEELFLLCSLFPEDSEIKKEDLIRMGIGLGLFGNVNSCNNARRKGRWAIGKLLDSFLLLQAKDGVSVMLHDILRAVALRTAVNKIQTILEPIGRRSLMKLPEHLATEEITKLYCYNIHEFPLQFNCPNLEILVVCKDAKGSPKLPNEFFKEMGGLKVLTVMDKSSWQKSTLMLPESIWSLKLLRTLCIRGCRLDSNFSLEQLKHLEILEFCNCSIMQLPNDIAELEKLKLLDVSRCRVKGNPYKVLGNCEELEELYFSEIDLDRAALKDQNLAEFFEKNNCLSKLERYNVQIGAHVEKLKDDPKSRFLSISPYSDQDTSISTRAIKVLAQNAEVLFLENIPISVENVIPNIVFQEEGCLKDLIELLICNSEGIKYLIDTTRQLNQNATILSNLLKLRITGMKCMEGFCKGEATCGLFEQLKELECSQLPVLSSLGNPKLCNLVILKFDSCPKLESLFSPAIAVSLSLLEELKVTKCHGLMYIIEDDKEEDTTDDNDQKTYKSVFQKLKELVVGDCSKLKYLIPLSFAWGLENLKILKIYLAPNLKYVFGKYNHPYQSSYQNQNVTHIINLPVLKVLELLNLEEIISICPKNYNAKFPDFLESHIVDKCPNLDTIISTNAPRVDSEIEVQVHPEGEPPKKAKLSFMPFGTSIVARNIKEWVFAPIQRQARYSLSFNTYVKDLQSETETLKFTTASLQDRAEGDTLQLDSNVNEWLVNADTLIKEAEKLEEKAIEYQSCCFGRFPNWIQQYRIGKQAERKINAMIKHNQSREFQKFSQRATLPCMDDYFKGSFILFDSRKTIYYSVLELLKENEISIIGLHGTGGCGKTTLAKLVAKEAEQLFDRVIFVDVSSNRDVQQIQEKIARSLNWKLPVASESIKAQKLFMRLSTGERVLIILDNARDRLNLEDIGIPFGVNHKGCVVLIITRSKQVCIMMDCQRMFSLLPLSDEEAWLLLQRHALIREDTNDSLKDVAKEVAQECGGLPIAILAMASTLKGKTEDGWKEALKMLRSPMDSEAELGSIYKCLQVSYHNLADENAKSLFLLCSVFPEDVEIHEEHLMRYGIVLGLFGEVCSYEKARDKVKEAKEKLIDSCLLFKEDKGQWVKMHGLFHDMALSIANKEIVALEGTHEWQLGNTIRYLWCEKVDKLPNQFYFPKLEFLRLSVLNDLMLPDEFFNGMKYLRVLILRSYSLKKNLKLTTLSLPNLAGLFLEGWELGDIFFVVRLSKLEALGLRICSFQEIPNEITELRKLRLLELCNCKIERNNCEAIGRCSQLQELYFTGNSCSKWNYQSENGVAFFQEKEIALKLERYCVEIGKFYGVIPKGDFSTSRSLYIEYFDASSSNATIKNLVQRAEVLSLGKISGGCENIIPDMVQKIGEGMNELIELQLKNSDDIKCITGNIGHVGAFFPCLTKLYINSLKHMEALCIGPTPASSFQKLKELKLSNCPLLESLFTVAVAQSLEMLEIMSINTCDRLKHIIWDADADTEAKEEIITTDDDDQKSILAFPKLEVLIVQYCHNIEFLGGHWLLNFGSLKALNVGNCSSLKSLFTSSTAKTMTSLEELDIKYCSSLKEVFGAPYCEDGQALTLTRLKMLRITKLPNLIEVSRGFKLQHVINVEVDNCPNFHGPVVGFQNLSQGQNPGERKIRIRGLHGMESLCSGPTPASSLEKLKELELRECSSLKSLLTVAVTQSLEMLQILRIIKCDSLEHLIWDADANRDTEKEIITIDYYQKSLSAFPKLEVLYISHCKNLEYLGGHWLLNFSNLKVLKALFCSSLKSMFTPSTAKTMTSLEELSILECPSLKEVFGVPNGEDGQALSLPRLKMFKFTKLPNLIEVSRGFKLQHVINAEVHDCPVFVVQFDGLRDLSQAENADEIKYIADTTVQVGAFFPGLTKLRTQGFHGKESLCCRPTSASSFENLKELELRECPSLKSLFTLAVAQSLKMLQALKIIKCDRLKHIISNADADKYDQKSMSAFPKLEQIFVEDCVDLECLGGHWSFNLCKLKRLIVKSCSKVKSLYTASTARTMTSLEELIIRKCDSLEEVFGICHDEDNLAITLPRLKTLTLIELPKLVKVSHEFKLQNVINVLVEGRPMSLQGGINDTIKGPPIPMLYRPIANFKAQDRIPDEVKCITDTTRHVGAFFLVLTKLTIRGLHDMESLWIDQAPTSLFEKLKELELYNCPLLKSLFTVAIAQSLEMLHVMVITSCPSLQHVITTNDDQKNISVFPNLEMLCVRDCENLKHLGGHGSFNLYNLKRLFVESCSKMKSLFPASTAKTMTSLDELIVKRCGSLEEVFGVPHGEESQVLTLPRLKNLALIEVPNLRVVSHGFALQRVINVVVDGRYNPMFHEAVVGLPTLFQGQNPDEIKCITNTTRHIGAFFPGFTKLAIRRLLRMESLCCGPTQAGWFDKLKELEFFDCPSLKSLFTVAVAQSLQMLQVLKITACRRLKHIICDTDGNAKKEIITVDDRQKCNDAFPKLELLMVNDCKYLEYLGGHWLLNLGSLKKLNITCCRSLKSLFTPSTAKTMTSLEELFIKRCSSLKEVFGVPYGEDGEALALPGLKMITFIRLPNLIEVSNEFKLQHVIKAAVKDCPKFHGPVDYFQNLTQGHNPELDSESDFDTESNFDTESESEEEVEDIIGQSTAKSQESCEVHNAQAGTSNMINTASSSGEVDVVQGSCTNISKEHRDVTQTSSVASLAATNQDVPSNTPTTALDQEYQTPAIKASSPSEATAVQRSSNNITKENRDFIPQTSVAQDANLNGEDQRDSNKKEMGSTYNLPMHHGENVENGDCHSASKIKGTATEETRVQTVKEPVQVQATLKIDQNVHGINFREGEDMVSQEHDTSSKAENAGQDTSKEYDQEHFPISEKYSVATSSLGGKDFDSQIATNQDAYLSNSLTKTNPEYQIQEEGGNPKEMEEMNVIEQSTKQTGIPLQVCNQIGKDIKSGKLPKTEVITGVGGQLHTKGLYARIIPIGTPDKLQEHDIPPTGSLHLIEIIGETTMGSVQKNLQSEKSTMEISSLELVKKTSKTRPISMDHQEEAFEMNKVSPGDMPTGLDLQVATEQDKNELHLDNVNTGTGSSGKATLELPSLLPVVQNVDISTPSVIPAPIQALASSVSFASIQALPAQVDLMMCSSSGKFLMTPDEEYATFRGIVAIKKKHIPLLEKAIASYPSLWAWLEKPMLPKMKQFGYSVLGDMLEFLASTKWTDLTEKRKAEFQFLLDGLETFGFDTQWIANTCVQIKKSNAINRMKMLEQQAIALESELEKTKLELEILNNFIGF